MPACGGRVCPVAVRHVEHVIAHAAEAELVDQCGADGVRPADGNALVERLRVAGVVSKVRAARDFAEGAGRLLGVGGVAIPAENGVLFVEVVIFASVPLVAGDGDIAVDRIVVLVTARQQRCWCSGSGK